MKRRARGYTVVELMMSLAVFATGVVGIIAMQRAVVSSNQQARNVTVANAIAQSWLSQLSADSSRWTARWSVSQTTWLSTIAGNDGVWQLPTYNSTLGFGPQFDGFGAPVTAGGQFCAQIRLTWLYGDNSPAQATGIAGNGVIRTEVRVFWPRQQRATAGDLSVDLRTRFATDCTNGSASTVAGVVSAFSDGTYHVIVQAAAVRQPS